MKVKIPKEIKITTHPYKIKFTPHLTLDDGFSGTVNHRTLTIEIEPIIPQSRKLLALLHEVVHIINKVYCCGLEEENVDRLASGIAEMLDSFGLEFDWVDIEK